MEHDIQTWKKFKKASKKQIKKGKKMSQTLVNHVMVVLETDQNIFDNAKILFMNIFVCWGVFGVIRQCKPSRLMT